MSEMHLEISGVSRDMSHQETVSIPIGSMYGIYANIWGILMVNVTIYGIHGSYGISEPLHHVVSRGFPVHR
jgi:hypothetical protein